MLPGFEPSGQHRQDRLPRQAKGILSVVVTHSYPGIFFSPHFFPTEGAFFPLPMYFKMRHSICCQVVINTNSLKFSKRIHKFKFISERRHLKILSPNLDISKSYQFSAQKLWKCIVLDISLEYSPSSHTSAIWDNKALLACRQSSFQSQCSGS